MTIMTDTISLTIGNQDFTFTEISDSLWVVETYGDYHKEQARLIADELACGCGTRWDYVPAVKALWMARGRNEK